MCVCVCVRVCVLWGVGVGGPFDSIRKSVAFSLVMDRWMGCNFTSFSIVFVIS